MNSFPTSFMGRTFQDNNKFYRIIERYPTGFAKNKIWCYTVEKVAELPHEDAKNRNEEKNVVRLVRWQARNDENDPDIKYWRYRSSYNIRSKAEWENSYKYINNLVSFDLTNQNFIPVLKDNYNEILEEVDKKTEELNALYEEINRLKSVEKTLEAESAIFKKRIQIMKSEKKKYYTFLDTFEELINDKNVNETIVHKFIKKNQPFWMFGLEYVDMESKVRFPPGKNEYEFDLMLKRFDNFYDLVELKGPNEKLFHQVSNRYQPKNKLTQALGQVFRYVYVCDTCKEIEFKLLRPKAFIVIGNESTDNLDERRLFSSFLNGVEVLTYSELYERGKKLIEYIDRI